MSTKKIYIYNHHSNMDNSVHRPHVYKTGGQKPPHFYKKTGRGLETAGFNPFLSTKLQKIAQSIKNHNINLF